ncbi:hypothetical protein MD588_05825 [Photobacterium sp. SDRW27]|uniref:hypothetical protein n=1 Tax=Photobacterium obscurum TaxID=2829490 RepID=UPI002244A594|nr:hypothetical protein [Photobacterium obscurum]MCW8328323.1 hypothetical protein [Photobacterium obscurum]
MRYVVFCGSGEFQGIADTYSPADAALEVLQEQLAGVDCSNLELAPCDDLGKASLLVYELTGDLPAHLAASEKHGLGDIPTKGEPYAFIEV